MILGDGATVPDELLIGVITGEWPIKVFYDSRSQAAEWMAEPTESVIRRKHVLRVRLEIVEELEYVPPVPASLRPKEAKAWPSPSPQ